MERGGKKKSEAECVLWIYREQLRGRKQGQLWGKLWAGGRLNIGLWNKILPWHLGPELHSVFTACSMSVCISDVSPAASQEAKLYCLVWYLHHFEQVSFFFPP